MERLVLELGCLMCVIVGQSRSCGCETSDRWSDVASCSLVFLKSTDASSDHNLHHDDLLLVVTKSFLNTDPQHFHHSNLSWTKQNINDVRHLLFTVHSTATTAGYITVTTDTQHGCFSADTDKTAMKIVS